MNRVSIQSVAVRSTTGDVVYDPGSASSMTVGVEEDDEFVCRKLRSKGAGVVYGEPATWNAGFYPDAVFWGVQTADQVGPDDMFVHPHVCTAARACFCGPIDR